MPSGGKDNLQAGLGVEIQRGSFASRKDDERNHAPARNETSDGRILEGSGWVVGKPSFPHELLPNDGFSSARLQVQHKTSRAYSVKAQTGFR